MLAISACDTLQANVRDRRVYLELLITQSILPSPVGFEISRVDCMFTYVSNVLKLVLFLYTV